MSDNKKFTKEELEEINALRNANAQKISEFGQIEVEILLTNQQIVALEKTKGKLQNDYVELQNKEREFVQKLNKKYGAGTVDINSGEFIPAK
jgi:hypothetical protein